MGALCKIYHSDYDLINYSNFAKKSERLRRMGGIGPRVVDVVLVQT